MSVRVTSEIVSELNVAHLDMDAFATAIAARPSGLEAPLEECAEQGERVIDSPRDIVQGIAAAASVDDAGDAGYGHLVREPDQKAGMHSDWIAVEHLEREPGHPSWSSSGSSAAIRRLSA